MSSELDLYSELIWSVHTALLQGQLRGEELGAFGEQTLDDLFAKVMASTAEDPKKIMDALSDIVCVKREFDLPTAPAMWEQLRAWLIDHWIEEPEFVQNSLWMIAHGRMRDLYFRIEAALQDGHPDTRQDATEAWAMLREEGELLGR